MEKKLTQKRLKELFHYNPETGFFRWRDDGRKHKFGEVVGENCNSYISVGIDGKNYGAHRLVWLYIYGFLPENIIDHANRNPSDNRLKNLREASKQCNARNCNISKNNTSGVTGVSRSGKNKWRARIKINRVEKQLGIFCDFKDAVFCRWEAEKNYNFPDCNTFSAAFVYLKYNGHL